MEGDVAIMLDADVEKTSKFRKRRHPTSAAMD